MGPDADRQLVLRVAAGDRDAAADFVRRFGGRLRARVRAELGEHVRRLYDSQDILATVSRRLDAMVMHGEVRAETSPQLFGLITQLVRRAVVDKARFIDRLRRVEAEDRGLADCIDAAEALPEQTVIEWAFSMTEDSVDRTILSLWLHEHPHAEIASAVGLSEEACRWRWHRIRGRLRDRFMQEAA